MRWKSCSLWLAVLVGGCCFGGGDGNPLITLAPGFTPQPTTQTGTMESLIVDGATQLGWECQVWLPSTPQHLVNVTSPMFVRVLANAHGAPVRLAVRYPDGVVRCSDFMSPNEPAVEGFAGVGTLAVFVGSPNSTQTGDYTIGFTEAHGTPSSVLQ